MTTNRTADLRARVTDDEKALAERFAAQRGQTVSEIIRAAFGLDGKPAMTQPAALLRHEALCELRRRNEELYNAVMVHAYSVVTQE